MINQMVINTPHWAVWMSAADEYRHSLCGSGAVDSVSIGDGVELDRLRLPSLLHVAHKETAGAQTHERWMEQTHTHSQSHTHTHSQVSGQGLTGAGDTAVRSRAGGTDMSFLMGGCEWSGRWNVTKIFTFVFRTAWLCLWQRPLCWWREVLLCPCYNQNERRELGSALLLYSIRLLFLTTAILATI